MSLPVLDTLTICLLFSFIHSFFLFLWADSTSPTGCLSAVLPRPHTPWFNLLFNTVQWQKHIFWFIISQWLWWTRTHTAHAQSKHKGRHTYTDLHVFNHVHPNIYIWLNGSLSSVKCVTFDLAKSQFHMYSRYRDTCTECIWVNLNKILHPWSCCFLTLHVVVWRGNGRTSTISQTETDTGGGICNPCHCFNNSCQCCGVFYTHSPHASLSQ